jgi:4-hydroxy 2-oxovalerate aldolase
MMIAFGDQPRPTTWRDASGDTVTITFVDCTLRDGGYHNNWDFSVALTDEYLTAMAALGTDRVELGFRSLRRDGFKGSAAFTTDGFIDLLAVPAGMTLGVMINAAEIRLAPDEQRLALAMLFPPSSRDRVRLVRIAAHLEEVAASLGAIDWLRAEGYEVGINLMQVSEATLDDVRRLAQLIAPHRPDVLYFADSMGNLDGERVSAICGALRAGWDGPLGLHAHDNIGLALANTSAAIAAGATWVDATVTGMGRGPGNTRTELLVLNLAARGWPIGDIAPLLRLVRDRFAPIQHDHGWGTNAFYYLAGQHSIHPSFLQELLTDGRYGIEEVLAAVENLRDAKARHFDVRTLEGARDFFATAGGGGSWSPVSVLMGREVLILGTGPSIAAHREAVEAYVRTRQPYVIALNTAQPIDPGLIDAHAACHPLRVLSDADRHAAIAAPLIVPLAALPEGSAIHRAPKVLLDFGVTVDAQRLTIGATAAVLPTPAVFAYAMAAAVAGQASRVLLAGFDGYAAGDPRRAEDQAVFTRFLSDAATPLLLAVTPTAFDLPSTSIYALLD